MASDSMTIRGRRNWFASTENRSRGLLLAYRSRLRSKERRDESWVTRLTVRHTGGRISQNTRKNGGGKRGRREKADSLCTRNLSPRIALMKGKLTAPTKGGGENKGRKFPCRRSGKSRLGKSNRIGVSREKRRRDMGD